ncbi:Dynactin subunit 4 [Neolecta irregularis DAH-3]|uniref:Dynactin subunit 4 n=1 Tax=Neolecta irregularis (strain DAH-3) TaxID=1198029 RepID=A0A1U7LWU4_NEOID|nr:Dynactin subunit 4 [Neolecta irregularis DAH-3]|eukprot:OLL26981.1 Dynactin subunit 4 [Neolecta irregularis DAH-3]
MLKRDTPASKQAHSFGIIKTHYEEYIETEKTREDPHAQFSRILGLSGGIFGKRKSVTPKIQKAELEPVEIPDESELIQHLEKASINDVTSLSQRLAQVYSTPKISELYPIPRSLRAKRSKRCRACRHILVRPEAKPLAIRYRHKLLAMNYIPAITLSPLNLASDKQTYILRLTNPLYDSIKVSLATPPQTTTKYRITLLCPDFEVGPNADVWDQTSAVVRPTDLKKPINAEEGAIWDSGRNWTSTILEIVPPEDNNKVEQLEISMFVKLVYETEIEKEEDECGKAKLVKVDREIGFWSVIGI